MEIVKFSIKGMTCDDCARHIERLFNHKEGVREKKVSLHRASGEFIYDPEKISKEEIRQTINATPHYRIVKEISDETGKKPEQASGTETKMISENSFDLIIIGGGSAAFSAALTAQEKGVRILMVNAGLPIGGTCVNVGCVPSKNLIRIAEAVHHASVSNFKGIKLQKPDINFKELIRENARLVSGLREKKYIDVIKNKKGITRLEGWARFIDSNTIEVNDIRYQSSLFIIATGASTNIPPIKGIDTIDYLTNKSLFKLEKLPETLTILGAGYIGLEMAMVFNRLGTKVRVLEFTDRVLRTQTPDISLEIEKHMKQEGIAVLPNHRIEEFIKKNGEIILKGTDLESGKAFEFSEKEKVLVTTGIKANTQKLELENIRLQLDQKGNIVVNAHQETNIPGIYAAGDCTNTPAFVYTAAAEAKTAALNALENSRAATTDYTGLPWVVFTDPQVAGAGMDEQEAAQKEIPFETATISLADIPRALAANDTRGFIKLIRNSETDALLGIRVVAPEGGELVMQASLAIKYGITVSELANSLFPYLTLSEGIKLTAITFHKDVKELSCCAV